MIRALISGFSHWGEDMVWGLVHEFAERSSAVQGFFCILFGAGPNLWSSTGIRISIAAGIRISLTELHF